MVEEVDKEEVGDNKNAGDDKGLSILDTIFFDTSILIATSTNTPTPSATFSGLLTPITTFLSSHNSVVRTLYFLDIDFHISDLFLPIVTSSSFLTPSFNISSTFIATFPDSMTSDFGTSGFSIASFSTLSFSTFIVIHLCLLFFPTCYTTSFFLIQVIRLTLLILNDDYVVQHLISPLGISR